MSDAPHAAPGRARAQPHHHLPGDAIIRARCRATADGYYAGLHRVLEPPEAAAHDTLVVRRFHRRRQRRLRALLDPPSRPAVEQRGGAEA